MKIHLFSSPPITLKVDDMSLITAQATKMVNLLTDENKRLREEVVLSSKKLLKLQKVSL